MKCAICYLLLVFFHKTFLEGTEFIQHDLQFLWLRENGCPINSQISSLAKLYTVEMIFSLPEVVRPGSLTEP